MWASRWRKGPREAGYSRETESPGSLWKELAPQALRGQNVPSSGPQNREVTAGCDKEPPRLWSFVKEARGHSHSHPDLGAFGTRSSSPAALGRPLPLTAVAPPHLPGSYWPTAMYSEGRPGDGTPRTGTPLCPGPFSPPRMTPCWSPGHLPPNRISTARRVLGTHRKHAPTWKTAPPGRGEGRPQ